MIIYSFKYIAAFFVLFWIYWLFCRSKNTQNGLLLITSYVFYGLWDLKCLPLLLAISLAAYGAGFYFKRHPRNEETILHKTKQWWVSFGTIVFSLSILLYFKYSNFFLQSISDLTGAKFEHLNIFLPLGISFYTFSAISYVVECYQKKVEPTTDFISVMLYTSFFPAILSGPIHNATEQFPQWQKKREFSYYLVNQGFKDFLWGAFMKLCVADRLGIYVDAVYGNIENHSGITLLITSVAYTFQIYADFAGYSLMAVGCGKMLGIRLQNNFDRPYLAKTITEFWSKWHISLTRWFKNYVYFPLGGNRVGKVRWMFNILIVFLLSGLWHGAAYTFIMWGVIHGVALVIEKLIYGKKIKEISNKTPILNILRVLITFTIVNFAWIFFRLPDAQQAFVVLGKIFTDRGTIFMEPTLFLALISLAILLAKDCKNQMRCKLSFLYSENMIVRYLSVAAMISFILLFGVLDGSQFIYFQF